MCLAVYIASDIILPTSSWDKAAPGFYVEKEPDNHSVAKQFTLGRIYYAGSDQGCGCGFFKEGVVGDELEQSQANYDSLVLYLKEAQDSGASIEIYACWEGQQTAKPEFRESRTVVELGHPSFEFKEQQFIRIEGYA